MAYKYDPISKILIRTKDGSWGMRDSKTVDSPVIRNKIESTIKKLENIKKMYNTEENKIDDNIRLKPEEKKKAYEDLEKQYKNMIINVLDTLKNNL